MTWISDILKCVSYDYQFASNTPQIKPKHESAQILINVAQPARRNCGLLAPPAGLVANRRRRGSDGERAEETPVGARGPIDMMMFAELSLL